MGFPHGHRKAITPVANHSHDRHGGPDGAQVVRIKSSAATSITESDAHHSDNSADRSRLRRLRFKQGYSFLIGGSAI